MRTDKHLAIRLRRDGKSYNQISKELNIPKSTLHNWFKDNRWSEDIKRSLIKKARILAVPKLRMMAQANKKKWEKIHLQYQKNAKDEFNVLTREPLFLAGLMLYWGEGDRVLKNGQVRLSNSDPEMIKIFYLFLEKVVLVPREKIFIKLILYPEMKEKSYKIFWSKVLNISLSQFEKTVVIAGRHPTKRLSFGICLIEVRSRELKEKILAWIKLYHTYFGEKYPRVI